MFNDQRKCSVFELSFVVSSLPDLAHPDISSPKWLVIFDLLEEILDSTKLC